MINKKTSSLKMHSIKDLSYLIAKHIECVKTFLLIEALQKKINHSTLMKWRNTSA